MKVTEEQLVAPICQSSTVPDNRLHFHKINHNPISLIILLKVRSPIGRGK